MGVYISLSSEIGGLALIQCRSIALKGTNTVLAAPLLMLDQKRRAKKIK